MRTPYPLLEETRISHQISSPVFSGVKPDRNLVATHQIYLATLLGLWESQCVERGVGSHLEPCRIRIPNYFCL